MNTNAALKEEPAPIRACTVCRDVQEFDLLIEDMETIFGEGWGDLTFPDAALFLGQPDAKTLDVIVIALDEEDEANVPQIEELIAAARARDVGALIIAEDVSPMVLHRLLKHGAAEFVPYPLPDGALQDAISRLDEPAPAAPAEVADDAPPERRLKPSRQNRNGVILPVHGLAGGVGATTFAVNFANELTLVDKDKAPRVCLLDMNLQTGAAATYLDLPQREAVVELMSDTESMDGESFMQALQSFDDRLHVLTAPPDLVPLDFIGPEDVERLIDCAASQFDYVIIDMPTTIVHWTETVLNRAHVYFTLLEIDMRSAQNALRLIRALRSEDLPVEKLRYILNRAPKFTDLGGKSRVKRMAESLDISLEVQLPDGGRPVVDSCDQGTPLADSAKKNALRKEIGKLAASAHELNRDATEME